jgi:hypothetical protein
MSSAVALRPSSSRSQKLSLFDRAGGEPTLDDVLAGVWEGLAARATAGCPVCGGRMEPAYGARADRDRAPGAARCTSCGSSLS